MFWGHSLWAGPGDAGASLAEVAPRAPSEARLVELNPFCEQYTQ